MRRLTRRAALAGLAASLAIGLPSAGLSEDSYPDKPVRVVVPFGPGSGTDTAARIVAQKLSEHFNQQVVVENKPGASGIIAAEAVARAPADGYTIILASNTTHAANPSLFKRLPYDPVKDFAPVTLLVKSGLVLVVNPDLPVSSVAELTALARQEPGRLNFGAGSSSSRISGEMYKTLAGIDMTHIPYKSNPPAIQDLIGGQIQVMFADLSTGIPQYKGGKLKALATTGSRRAIAAPELPTMAEAGVSGFEMSNWVGFFAPAGTPRPVIDRLNAAIREISELPDVRAALSANGSEVATGTPEAFGIFQAAEIERWAGIVKAAGIEPE